MRRPITLAVSALSALAGLSCDLPIFAGCTDLACQSSVRLVMRDVTGSEVRTFQGLMVVDGRSLTFECVDGISPNIDVPCAGNEVEVPLESEPSNSTIHVVVETKPFPARFDGLVTLERETVRPNGPNCPPECTTASATIILQ
jgi:hypothetical protein